MNIRSMMNVLTAIVVALSVSSQAYANDPLDKTHKDRPSKLVNWKIVESNYVRDLKSDNSGVRISAAYHIGEYHLEGAIGALKEVLTSDVHESARMASALALVRLGVPDAFEVLEIASKTNENAKVAQFCSCLISACGDKFETPLRYSAER